MSRRELEGKGVDEMGCTERDMDAQLCSLRSTISSVLSSNTFAPLPGSRRASVALILRLSPSNAASLRRKRSLEVLLIQRAVRASDPWSAHIAFPGGRRSSSDESDLATASRETQEEIGLSLTDDSFSYVGRLRDRAIRTGGRSFEGVMCAFVFLQMKPTALRGSLLQVDEVTSAFWVPLSDLRSGTASSCAHVLEMRGPVLGGVGLAMRMCKAVGIARIRMPAVDVLPLAREAAYADGKSAACAPHTLLWGLTLSCVGDFLQALGGWRVDWPSALPDNVFVVAVVGAFVAVWGFVRLCLFGDRFAKLLEAVEG